jgi:hypothetical protein
MHSIVAVLRSNRLLMNSSEHGSIKGLTEYAASGQTTDVVAILAEPRNRKARRC